MYSRTRSRWLAETSGWSAANKALQSATLESALAQAELTDAQEAKNAIDIERLGYVGERDPLLARRQALKDTCDGAAGALNDAQNALAQWEANPPAGREIEVGGEKDI